ncbi:MAG TPA: hypothetical protein VJX67_22355 [Blastocatellia bacterium]|nr:hypothetical protein [Blastocatellia bacterium]
MKDTRVTMSHRIATTSLRVGVKPALISLLLLFLPFAAAQTAGAQDLQYEASIKDAAIYQQSHVHELVPLTPNQEGNVVVATLTNYTGYKVGWTVLTQDVWVTQVPQVRDICRSFPPEEVELDLKKLLGLPPAKPETNFVVFSASALTIFRPAPDPNPFSKYPCGNEIVANCGNQFPAGVTDTHKAWIAGQALGSYQLPNGYPWTHLGYTYYWGHGADIYGASEYVIRSGSPVQVTAIIPFKEYCAPAPH